MAKSQKKIMNMVYGLGAAVVILGALFKIMHWPYGNGMLIIGLVTEALVFTISAFEKVDSDLDWSLVYPELAGGDPKNEKQATDAERMLSKKLDSLLSDAKVDGELMVSLSKSIRNFEAAAKGIIPASDGIEATNRFSEQMALAATQMESLNSLYKVQMESASRNVEINNEISENANRLKEQMQSMTSNIATLNNVYGGMLSAMSNKS